jgi:hypothetical protein
LRVTSPKGVRYNKQHYKQGEEFELVGRQVRIQAKVLIGRRLAETADPVVLGSAPRMATREMTAEPEPEPAAPAPGPEQPEASPDSPPWFRAPSGGAPRRGRYGRRDLRPEDQQ